MTYKQREGGGAIKPKYMTEPNGNSKVVSVSNPADPTINVRELINETVQRIDDLSAEKFKRVDEKIAAEVRRIDEAMDLRSNSSAALGIAEAKRIDAIRAVDVAAVATANEKATAQATVLASQVSSSAETLRALVASTALSTEQKQAQTASQQNDRISSLEKALYEGIGKGRLADPQMEALLIQVKHLTDVQNTKQGSGEGMTKLYGWIIGGVAILIAIINYMNSK